jgi:hypothetical protein
MNPVSEKQLSFIRSLASERMVALAANPGILQRTLETSRDASAMIDSLKALPLDPREVDPTEQVRIDALKGALDNLSPRDREFARSLIRQWEDRGRLSDLQWPHVESLAAGPAPAANIEPGHYRIEGVVAKVVRSKTGSLYAKRLVGVTTGGRLDWDYAPELKEHFAGAEQVDDDTVRAEACRLQWGAEPGSEQLLALAKAHANDHESCMFCMRSLTDEEDGRSVEVGYGPICANKYGLPWGTPVSA